MITLNTQYDSNSNLATTVAVPTNDQLVAIQNALATILTVPSGKTSANIISVTLSVDCNDVPNLTVITN